MHRFKSARRDFCRDALAAAVAYHAMPGLGFGQQPQPRKVDLGPGASFHGARPFPNTDPWNLDISRVPVDPASDAIVRWIGADKGLHADFGAADGGKSIGIPYVVVPGNQPRVPVRFEVADESDPGPYPIPDDVPIEGGPNAPPGGDRHALIIDRDAWMLYELFSLSRQGGQWVAGSGAIFDLTRNTVRTAGFTSADAAGLPIFPGLARYDEVVERGEIRHALRFTCSRVRKAYIPPARHWVNKTRDASAPPMGTRVRLKASFDESKLPPPARVIARALKTYGMILADVGGDWFITGAPDRRWDDDTIGAIRGIRGRDLEVIKMGRVTAG